MHKITHITTVHHPFDQRIFHRECQSLAKGFDVSLICNTEKETVIDGVRLIPLGVGTIKSNPSFRILDRVKKIWRAYKKALETKSDIFHLHDPELLLIAPLLKKRTNAAVFFDSHEDNSAFMMQKEYLPGFLRVFFKNIVLFSEKRAAKKLDAIITADKGVENKFKCLGANAHTIFNFPRLDYFNLNINPADQPFDLVYHGSVPKYHFKNIFAIDDALSQKGFLVKWYVFGSIASESWVKEQIDKREQPERFFLGKKVQHNAVANEVIKAKIGIIPLPDLPKFQSNIPTKLFEYMALGMPVVLSNLPPSRPFVADEDCCFMVEPSDFSSYAEKIIMLLKNINLRYDMGEKGKQKAYNQYNWSKEAEKLTDLYTSYLITKNSL